MMQTFVKNVYMNLRVSGLSANKLIAQFGRVGARPKKSLETMLHENKEVNK